MALWGFLEHGKWLYGHDFMMAKELIKFIKAI